MTIRKVSQMEADAKAAQVESLLLRLKQGLIELPPGIPIVPFLQGDGKLDVAKGGAPATPDPITLGSLRDRYLEAHGNGMLEERTLSGIRLHFKHLVTALGETFPVGKLALSDLQAYVDRRARAKGLRPWLFCHSGKVMRSKKRSRTTGHKSGDGREKTLAGRMVTVGNREGAGLTALTGDEAHGHLKPTLAESTWSVLRGYHLLRHPFISARASKGIDQRLIQEWVGHLTVEVHKRYSRLYPSLQTEAIKSLFG